MAARARRWHQGSNTIDQLQWREVQFVSLGATFVRARLAVLLGTAVHQGSALFAKALHGKGWSGAIAQQPLGVTRVVELWFGLVRHKYCLNTQYSAVIDLPRKAQSPNRCQFGLCDGVWMRWVYFRAGGKSLGQPKDRRGFLRHS